MKTSTRKFLGKIALIVLLVFSITIFHYKADQLNIYNHILFREFYFLPIILAGFWFGFYGGVATSLSITLLYLPFVLSIPEGIIGHNFGNIMQVFLFNVFGVIIGLLRDREKRQQKKLLEAENLAAMGKAASCIAHDMKTPLISIGGFVQQVRRKVKDDNLKHKLDFAFQQVQRLEVLVGDMLAFAKPLNLKYQQGTINHLIEEIVMIVEEKASQNDITIVTELQGDVPIVEYDHHRMQQALLNLINNAIEASPRGREVSLHSQHRDSWVTVDIVDRGNGIPKEMHGNLFTPFFTTKNGGTGLGLPIAQKIIEAHKGSISILNNSEEGVTFQITIPLLRDKII
jgi:two-component system sensor histidine kinase HydH